MKKGLTTAIILAAAGGGYLLYRNFKSFAATFSASIGRIKLNTKASQQTGFLRAVFDVNLIVNNPSNFTGQLKGCKLNVIYQGKLLATINNNLQVNIPKQQAVTIPVQVAVPTLSIFSNLNSAIIALTGGQRLTFQVIGSVLTNYGEVKIDQTLNV